MVTLAEIYIYVDGQEQIAWNFYPEVFLIGSSSKIVQATYIHVWMLLIWSSYTSYS